ncbi:hypothetical protein [Lacticaseibacillus pantheris]|uniref:hypothetical protein n=1 Tax=Lacticaseibacillus pantheris TaxID=171523 RepID=UPI00265B2942|nr:hypothetical protein [Lacticaseibacillus pantheris]WKF86012.1 hypothetical protein QY874_05375 [Lacticaseibacillus pantheris]
MAMTITEKNMELLHELEDEFGSIADVPESNPKLKRLRRLLKGHDPQTRKHSKSWYSNRRMVEHIYSKTKSVAETVALTGLAQATISQMLHDIKMGMLDK